MHRNPPIQSDEKCPDCPNRIGGWCGRPHCLTEKERETLDSEARRAPQPMFTAEWVELKDVGHKNDFAKCK